MSQGKQLFTKLATAANQHGLDEQNSKRFAFIGLSIYAEIMGNKKASDHFQQRANDYKKVKISQKRLDKNPVLVDNINIEIESSTYQPHGLKTGVNYG